MVRGPWPRWALQLGLIKLLAWGAAVSGLAVLLAVGLLVVAGAFR